MDTIISIVLTGLCTGHILSLFKLTHILIQCLLLIVILLFALTLTAKTLTIALEE